MKLTQQQLLHAVRAAGAGRESFTCADVREQLGLSTKDRQKLNQFYRAFRTLQAASSAEIDKLGTNSYRLRTQEPEVPAELIEADVMEVERGELSEVPQPAQLEAQVRLQPSLAATTEHEDPERGEEAARASTALVAASHAASAVAVWRGLMLRFGRRVRSLFSGRTRSRHEASVGEASVGA